MFFLSQWRQIKSCLSSLCSGRIEHGLESAQWKRYREPSGEAALRPVHVSISLRFHTLHFDHIVESVSTIYSRSFAQGQPMNSQLKQIVQSEPGLFHQSRLEKARNATRLLCILAIFAFTSFALVDLYMVKGSVLPLYLVRLVCISAAIFIYWLAGRPQMKAYGMQTGVAIVIITGLGVVVLTGMTGGSASPYWTMIMLTFFTASMIMPFRPIQAAMVFLVIALFYDLWIMSTGSVSDDRSWVISNAGIWLSLVISVLAVIFIDDLRDREVADRQQLNALNSQLRDEIGEREKAENELRRTQQLDAVGRLAAGIAHELNNLLLVISSSAELIQRKSQHGEKYTSRILESAHRGARLTSDMLLFARKGHRQNRPFALNQVVSRIADVVAESQMLVTTVRTNLSSDEPWVSGDSQLISQALLNLCLNGVDAMESPGSLQISTKVVNDEVIISVTDPGKGMTPQELDRAFEPFYTTKAPGQGTGLGLSMVYGTIKDHEGSIVLNSELGAGTTAVIRLPKVASSLYEFSSSEEPAILSGLDGHILLVDDDVLVRNLMKEGLESAGFSVVEAEDGVHACTLFDASPDQFELVILDLVMPNMNGLEAYQMIRRQKPAQAVLLYSGNNDQKLAQVVEDPHTGFLQKPFRQVELLETVACLLKGQRQSTRAGLHKANHDGQDADGQYQTSG